MTFDPRAIFANLTEKERLKGHHSAEGRTLKTLSRALNGWSAGSLAPLDVLVLCDQAVEDWLKARLKLVAWSTPSYPRLLDRAAGAQLITRIEAVRLEKLHNARARARMEADNSGAHEIEATLEFCIQLVDKYW